MKYIVIYDACVLYPSAVRTILIELAMPGKDLFQAKWSDKIEAEWVGNLITNRPDLDPESLRRTALLMREAVPDSRVSNYESLISAIQLPDPDDAHVLAAAIRSKAQAVITFNMKDFPQNALQQYDLEAIHPDKFLMNQFDLSHGKVLDSIKKIRERNKKPTQTAEEYLNRLSVENLTAFSSCLEEFVHLI